MAPEERDQQFEKALARHLRSSAPSEGIAKWQAGLAAPGGACPDAETLAAYHERSLLPEERNICKGHIDGCPHCREILAQLQTTDELSLKAAGEEVHAMSQPEPVTSPLLHSRPRLRWLVPAGALAAALLVWIAMHENQSLRLPNPAEDKVAERQVPAAASPSSAPAARSPLPQSDAEGSSSKPQSAADDTATTNARVQPEYTTKVRKQDSLAQPSPPEPLAGKENNFRKDAQRDASQEALHAANQVALDAKATAGAPQQRGELQAQVQAPRASSQSQSSENLPKVSGPVPATLGQADALKKMKTAPPPLAPQIAGGTVAELSRSASAEQAAAASNSRLIAVPSPHFIWHVGPAGFIEFSADGGASWSRQTSGVLADLLAGSAPSDKVCWIVGRLGTVLLTTDGGAHWNSLPPPVKDDFGSVQASDALHARIWNSQNSKSFETSDGGITWKSTANR